MSTTFRVVDLTQASPQDEAKSPLQAGNIGTVDLDKLSGQLHEIRDALNPVIAEQAEEQPFHLSTMELALTVGLEGQVWFVAKGKAEASLKLVWSRP
jgi:hypothetical protein